MTACSDLSLILLSLLVFCKVDTKCCIWGFGSALADKAKTSLRKPRCHPDLVIRCRRVHLPDTHAWCWVPWVLLKNFLPLMIKTRGRMLVFPWLLSAERLSWSVFALKSQYYQWLLWLEAEWAVDSLHGPAKQELEQPMLCLPVWDRKSSTSYLTLTWKSIFFFTSWLLQVQFEDVKKTPNNNSKTPHQWHKQKTRLQFPWFFIIAPRNCLYDQYLMDGIKTDK